MGLAAFAMKIGHRSSVLATLLFGFKSVRQRAVFMLRAASERAPVIVRHLTAGNSVIEITLLMTA